VIVNELSIGRVLDLAENIVDRKRNGIWSRRDFFTRLGWGGIYFFMFSSLVGFVRSAFPRVLFQPPSRFKAGLPSDFALGEVSEKYKQDQRIWIVREDAGIAHGEWNSGNASCFLLKVVVG
jgi:hypothetical protein